jgi:Mrp family chromosome partitioning ATPase
MIRVRWKTVWAFRCSVSFRWRMEPSRWMRWPSEINISEAYHAIRTAIELSSSAGLPSSLLLTSNSPAEGKSTSSFALARDFALLGKKVLLIDADLRRPRCMSCSNWAMAPKGCHRFWRARPPS